MFTKYDLLLSVAKRDLIKKGLASKGDELLTKTQDSARRMFEAQYIPPLTKLAEKVPGKIPFICVSSETGSRLVIRCPFIACSSEIWGQSPETSPDYIEEHRNL